MNSKTLDEPWTQLPSDPLTQLLTDLLHCSNAIVSGVARMWKLYRHSSTWYGESVQLLHKLTSSV